MQTRLASILFLAAVSVLGAAQRAAADDYPSRPVRIIVPFGAGGPTDVFTRAIGDELQKSLKQAFVMENRPGAGSVIGTDLVAKSPPDGYTLLMISGTQTVNETLNTKKSYQLLRDFTAVSPLMISDLVLVVHPSVPAHNLAELLALARARPGTLNFASSGPGSNYHMAAELLKHLTGVNIVHVPYKGSSGARTDILGGQVQLMFDSVPTMAPMIQAGLVRAIATTGKTRSSILPDVPTLAEAGVPGYEASLWTGLVAPAGTPPQVVELLNREIIKVLTRPDIKASWEAQGATPMPMSSAAFQTLIASEIDKWAKVIKANHIQAY